MPPNLSILLQTALSLSEQFQTSLSSDVTNDVSFEDSPEPLSLLSASAVTLKSQTTKLSLLTITSPFTESAIAAVLTAVNDSVLPSLMTAALLVNAPTHTASFVAEVKVLSRSLLREFTSLVQEVKSVADQHHDQNNSNPKKSELSQSQKDQITSVTGRVWDACDTLNSLSNNGVVGFVVQKVQQWQDLVRDAIEELEDWDPEENDHGNNDLFVEDYDEENSDAHEYDENTTAALREFRKSSLRVLKPTAKIYPAIISHRLKSGGLLPSNSPATSFRIPPPIYITKLEALIADLQLISEYIDEAAGFLYESDIASATTYIGKAKDAAARAVSSVNYPWGAAENGGEKDKFIKFAKTWFDVIDEVMKSLESGSEQ